MQRAKEVARYTLDNGQVPDNSIYVPELMEAELLDVFETIRTLVSSFGYAVFEPVAKQTTTATKTAAAKKTTAKKPAAKKKVCQIEASSTVLQKSRKPLSCKEIVEAMAEAQLWTSPGGKTCRSFEKVFRRPLSSRAHVRPGLMS
ncbi:winged helix-turn-helix domain-containing protein [Stieleria sp. TO1_6]|uniref:TdeIII family type II restriction endonuclease n=1 Tax=Stieleria tagensis TaxID=2956795 RepID=UPI00209AB19B|nr:TdeIII family type II restriction endonuclease [Stieleria tagensis]MCO8125580.1 winged helix-turn-helix domain-containing protein [Stieleria tagensis]